MSGWCATLSVMVVRLLNPATFRRFLFVDRKKSSTSHMSQISYTIEKTKLSMLNMRALIWGPRSDLEVSRSKRCERAHSILCSIATYCPSSCA